MTDQQQYADAAHRYRLDSRIATGGMGVVWRATDTRLDRSVAVKVLKDEYADDATFRTRFDTEARNAAALHHANIAGIFDYDADPTDRAPFLVMELVEGKPLSALLQQAKAGGRELDTDVVRNLLAQAADGLAVAHRAGIVHRDVKPANLVVTADGKVKVTDFGIARAADAVQITHTGSVMGTPQYLAPEQARGEAAIPASDVYSLGVVAFECLAGHRPFDAGSAVATTLAHLQQPVPDLPSFVPADLARVVKRAMAKEPADRFADAAGFARALRDPASVIGGAGSAVPAPAPAPEGATMVLPTPQPPPAQPVERLTPASSYTAEPPTTTTPVAASNRDKASFPWAVVVMAVLLLAVLAVIAVLILGGGDEPPPAADPTAPATSATQPNSTPPTTEATTPSTSATTTEPSLVTVNEADYVGRDVADVEGELRSLGFEVTLDEIANDGTQTEDTVAGIDPSGSVADGSLITVTYYGAPPVTEPPTTETTSTPDVTDTPTVEGDAG